MNDFFEILPLILFILFGVFSSAMAKKKKAAELNRRKENLSEEDRQPESSNPFEMLSSKFEEKISEVDQYFKKLEQESFPRESKKSQTIPKQINIRERVSSNSDIKTNLKEDIKKLTKRLDKISAIKSSLKKQNSAKEYFIVNEILNKPKALM